MASIVYPTPGRLYLTPTKVKGDPATPNGTYLDGVEERAITYDPGFEASVRHVGVGADSGFRVRHIRVAPAKLFIPLRGQDTNSLKILLSHMTTDGSIFRPTGGTSTRPFAKLPTFALILRPDSTAEKYLYCPNWALSPETLSLIHHGEDGPQLVGAQLVLIATRPTSATSGVPSHEWAASATIAAAFTLAEGP